MSGVTGAHAHGTHRVGTARASRRDAKGMPRGLGDSRIRLRRAADGTFAGMDDATISLVELGRRLRAARFRLDLRQEDVTRWTGISASTLSRMELGRGGAVSLATWLAVSTSLGLPALAWPPADRPEWSVLERLAARGGWRRVAVGGNAIVLDRDPRPFPGLRNVQLPAERAVLVTVTVLTDVAAERQRLQHATDSMVGRTPTGRVVGGAILVVRSEANVRIAGGAWRRSHAGWIRALRDPGVAMPSRPGLAWLAARGTHLLPAA